LPTFAKPTAFLNQASDLYKTNVFVKRNEQTILLSNLFCLDITQIADMCPEKHAFFPVLLYRDSVQFGLPTESLQVKLT